MSADYWQMDVSDFFDKPLNPDDWSDGVPGPGDDAILNAAGSPFVVTWGPYSPYNQTVNSIQLSSNATLALSGNGGSFVFTATTGTGDGANAGYILVGGENTLAVGGTFNNSGSITLEQATTGPSAGLQIDSRTTLTGGGTIYLDFGFHDVITAATVGETLVNVNNTISGGGEIGAGGALVFTNRAKGVVDATGVFNTSTSEPLYLSSTKTMTSAGLIEATGSAGLIIATTTLAGAGGTILAADGCAVTLQGSTIDGGMFTTTGSGVIETGEIGEGVDVSSIAGSVVNAGVFDVGTVTELDAQGTLDNLATVNILGGSGGAGLIVSGAGLSLTGAGEVTLNGSSSAVIQGATVADVLTNVNNTINGGGQLGNGAMTLINEAGGVIDGSAGKYQTPMTIDTGSTMINDGLIESTGTAGVEIVSSAVNGSGGGVILATSQAYVSLLYATIVGGSLTTTGTGVIQTAENGHGVATSYLDGRASAVTNAGLFDISTVTEVSAQGTLDNGDTINILGGSGGAFLDIGGAGLTLTGAGQITLNGSSSAVIQGAAAADVLTNVNNTISGGGQLGDGALTLINGAAGVIDGSAGKYKSPMIINTGATVLNDGLIESTGTAGVVVDGAIKNTGVLEAAGGPMTVDGAVTGKGDAVIASGTLSFEAAFDEAVDFTGATGRLILAHAQSYTGKIAGFSTTGGMALDLRDVSFTSPGEATFSGGHASGVLTVSDGTHTATIKLVGDYQGATFTAASDGEGGVVVVAQTGEAPGTPTPSAQHFIAAMSTLRAGVSDLVAPNQEASRISLAMVAKPM
jgi:hypothetical protein